MSHNALVLGAAPNGTANIGTAIVRQLETLGWNVEAHNCSNGWGDQYGVPSRVDWNASDALIITLGRTAIEPFAEIEPETIEDVIRACLTLPLLCVRRWIEKRTRGGKVVLIGSYAHRHPFSNGTAYCAAKAGLDMAGRTLGWELTDQGVFTYVVHPYHVEGTPMWEGVQQGVQETKGMTREEADEYAKKDLKMNHLMTPDEVAQIVAMLLNTRAAAWMSGSNVELYGGTR